MVALPDYVRRYKNRHGKFYCYFRRDGVQTRMPDIAGDPAGFWSAYNGLIDAGKRGALEQMIDGYMASPDFAALAEDTRRDYSRYLLEFRDRFSQRNQHGIREIEAPDDVSPAALLYIRDEQSATPTRANHMISVIKTCYKWAIPRGLATSNPAAHVPAFKIKSDGRKAWPNWAFKLAQDEMRPDMMVAVALGYYTGQRLKDILSMQLNDLVKAKTRRGREIDCVRVRQHKTGKPLLIPVHPGLAPTIRELRLRGWFPLVAKSDTMQPYTTEQFQAAWSREMRKPKLAAIRGDGLSFHGLRKSAASNMAQMACSTDMIMSITGLSRNMVSTYTRGVDQLQLAVDAMDLWQKYDEA